MPQNMLQEWTSVKIRALKELPEAIYLIALSDGSQK